MASKRKHPGAAPVPLTLPASVEALLGPEAGALLDALHRPSPLSIRRNPWKPGAFTGEAVPWCDQGLYLPARPVFTLDPLLHAGAYYVQEAGSMLLEQAVKACGPLSADTIALDLCAAPGGKATHLASLLPPDALLVCNEPTRPRQAALQENLWKWGRPGTVITGAWPADLAPLGPYFDLIAVDAPCSGEGMFRKDAFARAQWSERLVEQCAAQQRDILDAAWNALRPGGHLIYSTCTWEARENEDQVARLIAAGAAYRPLPIDARWGVTTTDHGYRCYPHRLKGEGFFIAVLRKPGAHIPHRQGTSLGNVDQGPVRDWLKGGPHVPIEHNGTLHAIPAGRLQQVRTLQEHLHVLAPGIPVAVRKGDAWRPHAALALSTALNTGAFPVLDLELPDALRYLRGEALNASAAEGVRLVRHAGHALGWVSGAGRRWNNGWPAAWRIRMRP